MNLVNFFFQVCLCFTDASAQVLTTYFFSQDSCSFHSCFLVLRFSSCLFSQRPRHLSSWAADPYLGLVLLTLVISWCSLSESDWWWWEHRWWICEQLCSWRAWQQRLLSLYWGIAGQLHLQVFLLFKQLLLLFARKVWSLNLDHDYIIHHRLGTEAGGHVNSF